MLAATNLTEKIEEVSNSLSKRTTRSVTSPHNLITAVKNNLAKQELNAEPTEKQPNEAVLKELVEGKINDGDVSGALRVLSSEDSVAFPTPEVLEVLREKHPPESPDSSFPDPPHRTTLPDEVTVDEVIAAVRSSPNGSTGGIDGLRPQHLKDMLVGASNGATVALTASLADLTSLMLQRNIPDAVRGVLYGASLTGLRKKGGGLRPIAVRNTLRRLAGKVVVKRLGGDMETRVHPEQVGCGMKREVEAAVHAVCSFLEEGRNESQVLLKLDFHNAFNTIHRNVLLRFAKEAMPPYCSFVWQSYKHQSKLLFGQHTLESERGVQQGDPLGPLLFCLVIESLTKSLQSPLNVWFLDDGTVGGKIDGVLSDLQVIVEEGEKLGLELNPTRCELFAFGGSLHERLANQEAAVEACPGILFPSRSDLSLLGAPLLEEGLEEAVRAKTISDKNSGFWLRVLPSSSLASLINYNALRVSVGMRLSAKLCRPHICRGGASVDECGQHGLSCRSSGGRYSRHSALNEPLKRALTSA